VSELPLEQWRVWSRTDDRLQNFVLSDIRQMIGEIDRLRRERDHLKDLVQAYSDMAKAR
jgi:hypothetical protein